MIKGVQFSPVTSSSHFPPGWEHYDQHSGMFKHVCGCCGITFLAKKRTGVKFCGSTCRKRASNGHKTWMNWRICEHCHCNFSVAQPFQHAKYCSNACRQSAYRERKVKNGNR